VDERHEINAEIRQLEDCITPVLKVLLNKHTFLNAQEKVIIQTTISQLQVAYARALDQEATRSFTMHVADDKDGA